MLYYTTTHADIAESFLLGLSCLVGGDQFYIFISKTDASPKTQSYIAITTVLSTLFLAFALYDEYNRSLFDVTHVLYIVLLVIWGLILYQNVRNPFVTTYYISILGMVMTFLVIISCVHYSHQKELLPSFLSGMLFARLLPTILWIFVHQKKAESKSNLSSLSARLAFFRLVFCIISMILKFTSGNLDFSVLNAGIKHQYDWHVIRIYAFKNFGEHFRNLVERFKKPSNPIHYIIYPILIIITGLLLFFYSVVSHLGVPPVVHKFSHLYSHNLYSKIDIIKTISHLLGVALGTKYPASKTANSYYFPITLLGYGLYLFCFPILNNSFKISSLIVSYNFIILMGLMPGYFWSYSLGIIINTILNPSCCFEDQPGLIPCCGDKTESQCYCRLEPIFKTINSGKVFDCSILFFDNTLGLKYSQSGKCAILLIFDNDVSVCEQKSEQCCPSCCTSGECCLNLIGIYKIQSVTTATCDNCQLSIRFDGSCCDPSKCPTSSSSGNECGCETHNGKCCCLCLKCCKPDCPASDCKCCIHVCKGTCETSQCHCNNHIENGVRLFICYKTNGQEKCCIREIRPNSSKEFKDDLKIQKEFDIKSISIFDCCHNDLIVNIQCSMKNNFFRVSPINYPKKAIKPLSLTLMRDRTECCDGSPSNTCCCKNKEFVKVCVNYDISEPDCKMECKCKGQPGSCCCSRETPCQCCSCERGNCCCCCLTFKLNVNILTSFYNKIEPVRVKLVIIFWFFFLLLLMIAISSESKDKKKKLKSYEFYPIRSFETVNKELENNGMNSMHSVLDRLRTVQQSIFLQLFGEKDKKSDLDHIFQLCKCALDPYSLKTLRHYVLSKSSMLISSPHYINRRLNLELVKWSYCVGFVYTYIMLMFFKIQEYFLKWEEVWESEYLNYKRIMTGKFNNLTNKSKSSMSLMCEKDVKHKTILYTDTSKKVGWDSSNDEIDIHANLNERETEMNKDPPYRMDLRLMFFLDKWKHRVENLIFWTENETNVYDWTGFLKEYSGIRSWFFKFLPHIQMASHEMNIPMEKLKIGPEILQSKTFNLVS